MPLYTLKNVATGEIFEEMLTFAEYDEKLKDPNIIREWDGAPGFISGYNMKPAEGFRDLLRNVNKKHRGANVNTFD
jgi:hypothetical protein